VDLDMMSSIDLASTCSSNLGPFGFIQRLY
jgi:hypothetical protein